MDEIISKIFEKMTALVGLKALVWIVLAVICVMVALHIVIIIVHHIRGDEEELEMFKFIRVSFKPSKQIQTLERTLGDLKTEFEKVNQDSKHKTDVLKYIDEVGQNARMVLQKILSGEPADQVRVNFDAAMTFILHTIQHSVRNGRLGMSRIGVFAPALGEEGILKLVRGHGYSPDSQQNLRLSIAKSFAGSAFRTGEIHKTGDIEKLQGSFQKLKGQHKYRSLICVPIRYFDEIVGVLNIDATELDAFTEFDADILRFFANQLALLMAAHALQLKSIPSRIETALGKEPDPNG